MFFSFHQRLFGKKFQSLGFQITESGTAAWIRLALAIATMVLILTLAMLSVIGKRSMANLLFAFGQRPRYGPMTYGTKQGNRESTFLRFSVPPWSPPDPSYGPPDPSDGPPDPSDGPPDPSISPLDPSECLSDSQLTEKRRNGET